MNTLLQSLMIFMLILPMSAQKGMESWVVENESQITINGSSNVNKFTCASDSRSTRDTIKVSRRLGPQEICFERSEVKIDTRSFDCKHKTITKDFQATLQSDDHPHILITFLNLRCANLRQAHHHRAVGVVEIKIAGITQAYPIQFRVSPFDAGSKTLELHGSQAIDFKEFRLSAPEKLFGLIQVDETIDVHFALHLRQVR